MSALGKRRLITAFAAGLAGAAIVSVAGAAVFAASPDDTPQESSAAVANASLEDEAAAQGAVTYEQHEAAIEDFQTCLSDAGFEVSVTQGEGQRPTITGITVPDADGEPDDDTVRAANETVEACRVEHLSGVDVAWAAQQGEPSAEQLAEHTRLLRDCVAEAPAVSAEDAPEGVFFGEYANSSEAARMTISWSEFGTYAQCALEVEAITGLLSPMPTMIE